MADTYTAYEISEGRALEGVEALCAHLTVGGTFTNSTQPRSADVYRQLTLARHKIAARLVANGYSATQTEEAVLGVLEWLNVLEVAIWAELSNPITGVGEPNERFNALIGERDALLVLIDMRALDDLGADAGDTGGLGEFIAATGISKDEKRAVDDDSDYVGTRFKRGFGQSRRIPSYAAGDSAREEPA